MSRSAFIIRLTLRRSALAAWRCLSRGTVSLPSGPGTEPSSRESNCPLFGILMTVLDRFALLGLLADVASNGGAFESGRGLFAPAPANVPDVEPLPPKPV